MSEQSIPPLAPLEPIFNLDLGANGGLMVPRNLDELKQWISIEQAFWSWLQRESHSHTHSFHEASRQLLVASSSAIRASELELKANQPGEMSRYIEQAKAAIADVYIIKMLPHSSTPLAKQIDAARVSEGESYASYFAAVHLPPPQGQTIQPQPQHGLNGWRGMLDGLANKFPPAHLCEAGAAAATASAEQLRIKAETLVGEKALSLGALQRDYVVATTLIRETASNHLIDFNAAQSLRETEFAELREKHANEMALIHATFREKMSLRAPVDYWNKKKNRHENWTLGMGIAVFLLLCACCTLVAWEAKVLLGSLPPGTPPSPWILGRLILLSVFAVWGVRLVVRVFLSHLHLATDAAERVVMVETYLSLMEADKLPSDQDRQLILQALFRHAVGGIVKDEGIPPTFLDSISRMPK